MKKKIADEIDISLLLSKCVNGELQEHEKEKVTEWLQEDAGHSKLLKEIEDQTNLESRKKMIGRIDLGKEWGRFQNRILLLRKKRQAILKYAAVALLPVLIISYALIRNFLQGDSVPEITPGIRKAQLILSNGERIDLSAQSQQIHTREQGVRVESNNQSLIYIPEVAHTDKKTTLEYNQLLTGLGEEYQLVLSDGTKVWLNAETKLKYPVQFASGVHEVELDGEAYFEVVKNPDIPFVVKTPQMDIKVMGTSFNVTAYQEDETVKTTLVEGKVMVFTGDKRSYAKILKPNDQAIYDKSSKQLTVREVDAAMYGSWTRGYFAFEEESLEEIMNTLSRWYKIEVVFKDKEAGEGRFSGKLPRFENCVVLLEMIEKTTNVNCKVEGNNDVVITVR